MGMNRNSHCCFIIIDSAIHKDQNGYDSQSQRGEEQSLNNLKQILGLRSGGGVV